MQFIYELMFIAFHMYDFLYMMFLSIYQCRIEITLSLSGSTNTELDAESIFPLYVLLARPTSNVSLDGVSLAFFSL
jgi:hypothetical protein